MDNQNNKNISTIMARRILAIFGIVLIAVGEYLAVTPTAPDSNFSPYFWMTIVGIVILLVSLFMRKIPFIDTRLAGLKLSETIFGIFLAALLSGITILSLVLFQKYGRLNFIPVTLAWFASGIIYILAFRGRSLSGFKFIDWVKENKTELILISLATVIGAALRFYKLGELPRIIDGDEGLIGLFAQTTSSGDLANPFALWENIGSLYLQTVNWAFSVFGVSPFSLRLLPAISGTLAVPALYLFARRITGSRIAMISAFLLATSQAHIHFSRIASVGYIHSTWLVPLELYFLFSALEKRSSLRAAIGGVLLAIHFRVYLTSQIIVGLVAVYMLLAFVFFTPWFKKASRQALVFWGGYLLMMAPQLRYIFLNPNEFFNRMTQDGTLQGGWLQATMASTGQSAFGVLGGRVVHAFMALVYYPAYDFYGSSYPLLNIFMAILFLVGIGLVFVRMKSAGYLLLNGYFWSITVAIALFSLPPSADSYRMLAALPPAFIIAAVGLDQLLEIAGFQWSTARKTYFTVATSVILGISILSVWMYYSEFVGKCRYGGNVEGRFASYLGSYAHTVDENSKIFLLSDSIFFYGSHASVDFLSGRKQIINYADPMDSYQVVYGETIIASPPRIDELLSWVDMHPGGQIAKVMDCERTILVAYKIPDKSFEP